MIINKDCEKLMENDGSKSQDFECDDCENYTTCKRDFMKKLRDRYYMDETDLSTESSKEVGISIGELDTLMTMASNVIEVEVDHVKLSTRRCISSFMRKYNLDVPDGMAELGDEIVVKTDDIRALISASKRCAAWDQSEGSENPAAEFGMLFDAIFGTPEQFKESIKKQQEEKRYDASNRT